MKVSSVIKMNLHEEQTLKKPKVSSLLRLTGLINLLLSVYTFRRSMDLPVCLWISTESALQSHITFKLTDPLYGMWPCYSCSRDSRRHSPGTSPSGWCPALGTASGSAHPRSEEADVEGCRRGSWPPAPAPARRPSRSGPAPAAAGRETRKRVKGHGPQVHPTPNTGQDLSGCRPEARCIYTVNVYHQLIKNAYLNMGMNYDTTLQYRDK